MNFEQFFQTATGNTPFPYQTRFATGETLPDLVDVPTGIGKTAMAVLGWFGVGRTREILKINPPHLFGGGNTVSSR